MDKADIPISRPRLPPPILNKTVRAPSANHALTRHWPHPHGLPALCPGSTGYVCRVLFLLESTPTDKNKLSPEALPPQILYQHRGAKWCWPVVPLGGPDARFLSDEAAYWIPPHWFLPASWQLKKFIFKLASTWSQPVLMISNFCHPKWLPTSQ